MADIVVPLANVHEADWPLVGTKAAALGSLLAAGFPVPPGLCLTTHAFQLALAPYLSELQRQLTASDLADPTHAASTADAIAALLCDLAVPSPIVTELRAQLPLLGAGNSHLAVRSSATAEDRADISFAGQYRTLLGIRREEALLDAIVACWRSFYGASALFRRAQHGALGEAEGMAVLLQPVVTAECAGVAFSIDPAGQDPDCIVVNAGWGLGPAVVDGSASADTYWVRRSTLTVETRQVAEKAAQVVLDPEGGTLLVPVPDDRRRAACLPESWPVRVAQFAITAEQQMGRPQEVEWAIANGRFWILQSRPVTGLPPALATMTSFPVTWNGDEAQRSLWLPVPLAGTRTLLPLEFDFVEHAARSWPDKDLFDGEGQTIEVRFFQGRGYYRRIPSPLLPGDRRVRQAMMKDLAVRLEEQGLTLWDHWGPEVVSATRRLGAFRPERTDGPGLASQLEDAFGAYRRHWMVHNLLWSGSLERYYASYAALTGRPQREIEREADALLDGEETILSRLVDGLYDLAEVARAAPAVAALVAGLPVDVMSRLASIPEAADFRARLDTFLDEFGERTGHEGGSPPTVFRPTWRENPTLALRLVVPYLDPNVESPALARVRVRQARDAQVESLCAACPDGAIAAEFRRRLAYARRLGAIPEEHHHYIDQLGTGQIRTALLAAASWLVARGALADTGDIFWLRLAEIAAELRAESPRPFAAIIADRRAQYEAWRDLAAPPLLGLPDPILPERPPWRDELTPQAVPPTNILEGHAVSPGRSRARARLVLDSFHLPGVMPGEILVAENAGTHWAPLFPILAGLVLDHGTLAHHIAAVAREYGIPAVFGTRTATGRIPDGALITVDGTRGTVQVE